MKISVITIICVGFLFSIAECLVNSGENVYFILMLTIIGIWIEKDDKGKSKSPQDQ